MGQRADAINIFEDFIARLLLTASVEHRAGEDRCRRNRSERNILTEEDPEKILNVGMRRIVLSPMIAHPELVIR